VEARIGAVCRVTEARRELSARRENGAQRSRSVAPGQQQGLGVCAAQCLLRLARSSETHSQPIAQPAEPPDADPHVRWCDRESWRQPTYVNLTGTGGPEQGKTLPCEPHGPCLY
jgi:hypothetical protein